jgi:hypothetical protein
MTFLDNFNVNLPYLTKKVEKSLKMRTKNKKMPKRLEKVYITEYNI